jgi:hypothetical protein
MRIFSTTLFVIALISVVTPLILLFEFVQISPQTTASLYDYARPQVQYTEFIRETMESLSADESRALRAIRDELENTYEDTLDEDTPPVRTRVDIFEVETYTDEIVYGIASYTREGDKSCRLYVYRTDQDELKGYDTIRNVYCTPFLREAVR